MIILHISTATSWRGGEQQIACLVKGLNKNNIKNIVLCPENSPLSDYCTNHKIEKINFTKKGGLDLKLAKKIKNNANQFNVDIVHAHDAHAHTGCVLAKTLYSFTAKLVVHRRVSFPIGSNFLSKLKYNHPSIAAYICVSHAIEKVISKDVKRNNKINVVHSCINMDRFNRSFPEKRKQQQITIANVSALAAHKDYPTFVRTAKRVLQSKPEAKFQIIGGDAGCMDEIRTMIEQEELENQISMLGFQENIPELLNDIDIFLFTSDSEGLGTSLLDAMASKTAIVSTAVDGTPELVQHEKNGLLAAPGDDKKLAEHVLRIIGDPKLKQKLISAGYEKVREFSIPAMVAKTINIYKNL